MQELAGHSQVPLRLPALVKGTPLVHQLLTEPGPDGFDQSAAAIRHEGIRRESTRPRRSKSLNSAAQISLFSEEACQNPKALFSPLRSTPSATT